MDKYEATSRTLYRGCWFFDFLREIFVGITQRKDEMMGKIGKHAYTIGLAPHHGFMLKKTAGLAFNAIKRKDKFFAGIIKEQTKVQGIEYTEEMIYTDFEDLAITCAKLAEQLWAFCKEYKLTELP